MKNDEKSQIRLVNIRTISVPPRTMIPRITLSPRPSASKPYHPHEEDTDTDEPDNPGAYEESQEEHDYRTDPAEQQVRLGFLLAAHGSTTLFAAC